MAPAPHPVTPDGRYLVVDARLWRTSNPGLSAADRERLTRELMDARRAVGSALKAADAKAERQARSRVDAAKHALGERGPPWWTDGAPDYNRRLVKNTPYAPWFVTLRGAGSEAADQKISRALPPRRGAA